MTQVPYPLPILLPSLLPPHPLFLLPLQYPLPLKITLLPGMDYMNFDPLSTSEPYTSSAGIFGGKVITSPTLSSLLMSSN